MKINPRELYKVKFRKINLSPLDDIRTSEIIGHCTHLPLVGVAFVMLVASHDEALGGYKTISTPPIIQIDRDGDRLTLTMNNYSEYILEILSRPDLVS